MSVDTNGLRHPRDDRAITATCSLRITTNRFKENYSRAYNILLASYAPAGFSRPHRLFDGFSWTLYNAAAMVNTCCYCPGSVTWKVMYECLVSFQCIRTNFFLTNGTVYY